jgi:uncharacterized membrane protein
MLWNWRESAPKLRMGMVLNGAMLLICAIAAVLVMVAFVKVMEGLRWLAAFHPTAFVLFFILLVVLGSWLLVGAF